MFFSNISLNGIKPKSCQSQEEAGFHIQQDLQGQLTLNADGDQVFNSNTRTATPTPTPFTRSALGGSCSPIHAPGWDADNALSDPSPGGATAASASASASASEPTLSFGSYSPSAVVTVSERLYQNGCKQQQQQRQQQQSRPREEHRERRASKVIFAGKRSSSNKKFTEPGISMVGGTASPGPKGYSTCSHDHAYAEGWQGGRGEVRAGSKGVNAMGEDGDCGRSAGSRGCVNSGSRNGCDGCTSGIGEDSASGSGNCTLDDFMVQLANWRPFSCCGTTP